MKIKTKDLVGAALDWAVAKCEGVSPYIIGGACHINVSPADSDIFAPSLDWEQGGPIIEREDISIIRCDDDYGKDAQGFCNNVRIPVWAADRGQQSVEESTEHQHHDPMYQIYISSVTFGPTPLIAAMRCYVASQLGAEVDVPDELVEAA
jgi:hypothetical protein